LQLHLLMPAPQVTQRQIDGNSIRPCSKISLRIETRPRPIDSPERFHRQVLSSSRVPNNAHDPAIDSSLKLLKEDFEGIKIPRRESLQQAHSVSLLCSTRMDRPWFHFLRE